MAPRLPLAAALALALVLTSCGDEGAKAPGGVSPGEAKALEDAASMLDERKLPAEALPSDGPADAPGAAPSAEMTGDAAPAAQ
ncbi:MAG: hypothetical protein ACKO01_01590 [Erythrobacter sp.]